MHGPPPKAPELRQRTNKATTRATLSLVASRRRVPPLPDQHEWHPLTVAWWRDTWRSPMAAEFLPADVHALYLLADLIDQYWREPDVKLANEIRQQRQCFGLTPLDRRRLEWQVERVEAATRKSTPPPPAPTDDPRRVLSAV
jgi:hypothetical protein